MPRRKATKVARGNSQNTPRGGGRAGPKLERTSLPSKGIYSAGRGLHGFTLQEEARNTERHHSSWDSDQRLRHTKVNFVSAGALGMTKLDDADPGIANMSLEDADYMAEEEIEVIKEDNEGHVRTVMPSQERFRGNEPVAGFFVDTEGTKPIQTGLPPPRLRPISATASSSNEKVILFSDKARQASPTPSSSSEEVIVFGGRDEQGRVISRPPTVSRNSKPAPPLSIDDQIRVVEDKIHLKEELLDQVLHHSRNYVLRTVAPEFHEMSPLREDAETSRRQGRTSRRNRPGQHKAKARGEALLDDYIANMDPGELRALKAFGSRELGATDEELSQEIEASSGEPAVTNSHLVHSRWARFDLEDLDDLSTSDGVMGDVQAILSKRDRRRGVQYLVIWEDQTVNEARWVPATTLTSVQALAHIEEFEAREEMVPKFVDVEEEETSDSEDINEEDAQNDEKIKEDWLEKKRAAMSDDTIARLLAKQEELGMGSAELLLFDDDDDADEEELAVPKTSFSPVVPSSKQTRARGRGSKRPRGDFPSPTVLADAYDGFDIMDFDRPSLKAKSNVRKGKLPFDLSDSELEDSMQASWENDRSKKSRKKREREELRAQGMLRSINGKLDLKQKFQEGMGIHDVKQEIKAFLMSNHTAMALPPMGKADRRVVHEIANAFHLKSKSAGNGNKRFPILYRTSQNTFYSEATFATVEARLSGRFLPRMGISGKRARGSMKGFGVAQGGASSAAVSYRDGDIVGGSAPELGAENRGHAMLEKMGWSSGTALGALNNKGIMKPVTHVVKTTKAGLG